MKRNKEKIINFEVMGGWPIYKMNLRDILEGLGATYNSETKEYIIKDSDALDIFPRTLEDDGMGYGVNEKYITSFDLHNEKDGKFCNVFIDSGLARPDIWMKYDAFPGMDIMAKGKRYFVHDIILTDAENPIFVLKRRKCKDLLMTEKQFLNAKEKELEYNEKGIKESD